MPSNEAKAKYDIQYAKDKLKRIPLNVQKDKYEEIKAAATAAGEPVNAYIKTAIDMRMEQELDIGQTFGTDVLAELLKKARQEQETEDAEPVPASARK